MKRISRRSFLRGAGVCLALPALEAMAHAAGAPAPYRTVAINIPLGFIPEKFFPTQAGADYALSEYLTPAEALRQEFTVISGTSHPGVDGGHSAEKTFLTAAPRPGALAFRNTISLDQYMAQRIGEQTRFASLTLGDHSLSWSANGVEIPTERSPAKAFSRLFLTGTAQEVAAQQRELEEGRSIMDTVLEDAKSMQRHVSPRDGEKLDQFFTAVRETEQRLVKAQAWSQTPKPKVDAQPPPARLEWPDLPEMFRAQFEVIRLALETDSTRVIALGGTGFGSVPRIKGVEMGYHGLSHHGKNPDMLRQLELIDRATLSAIFEFLEKLKASREGGGSLLDHTQVLLGSNLGSANSHLTTNLPILLAGGGYKHGRHLAFDQKDNYPLPNLFVTMLQRMGIESDKFATSSGTMRGLELGRG
ncbi:MAG TPA: DUF1552 domain-containing protein [Chthoniobacteraceae bacterium]|nr:DUF1552 domain-containing protein [Chthoniobacteraceae bacterium]